MENIHPSNWLTLFLTIIEMFVFVGMFYGWPPLVYILKAEGYFSDLCQPNGTGYDVDAPFVCHAQDAKFNLMYTIGLTATFVNILPAGVALDNLGTRFTRIVSHFSIVVGLMLIVISDSSTTPYLLFPGFTAFCVGGSTLFISAMQVGNLFGRHRSTVMTIITGAIDGSSIMTLFVKFAYDNRVSLDTSFTILIVFSAVLFINTFYLLPMGSIPWPLPPNYVKIFAYDNRVSLDTSFTILMVFSTVLFINTFYLLPMGSIPWPLPPNYRLRCNSRKKRKTSLSISEHIVDQEVESPHDHQNNKEKYQNEDFPTLKSCILSPCFLLLCGWFCGLTLQMDFYSGSFNPFITQLTTGNDRLVEHYSEVYSYFLFSSMFFTPLMGLILDRNKGKPNRQPYDDIRDSALGFAVTTVLAILFAICNLIPVHQMQYVAFFFYVVAATFMYAGSYAVIAIMFPHRYYGTLSGTASLLVGLTQPLAHLLFRITQSHLKNDYRVMNVVLLVLCISTLVLPVFVLIYARRKNRERQSVELV